MNLLGMIGGMSWESTVEYYRRINLLVAQRLGGWNSASVLLHSVNFQDYLPLQEAGEWETFAAKLLHAAAGLEAAGCRAVMICSNTAHRAAPELEKALSVPLLHVGDPLGHALAAGGVRRASLLGTRFTMEGRFYAERLRSRFAIDAFPPESGDRDYIHNAIYTELARGKFLPATRERFSAIIARQKERGAQAVILGCTEIPLLIGRDDSVLPLFDTLELHLRGAAEFIINDRIGIDFDSNRDILDSK